MPVKSTAKKTPKAMLKRVISVRRRFRQMLRQARVESLGPCIVVLRGRAHWWRIASSGRMNAARIAG